MDEDFDSWLNKRLQKQKEDEFHKRFCDNCGIELNDLEINHYTSQSGMELTVCEKCLNNYLGKTKREIIKKVKVVKLSVVLITIIILLVIVSAIGYYFLDNTYSELKEQKQNLETELIITQNQLENNNSRLNSSESELVQVKNSFQENSSELQLLKSGDNYNLHDPLYNEVVQFIKDDNSNDEKTLIENAKNQGIRCAYVAVNIVGSTITWVGGPSSGAMYTLVAFNIVENGMIYYEPVTDYSVYPEIDKSYADCVEGSPYWSGYFTNDTITGIIVIW